MAMQCFELQQTQYNIQTVVRVVECSGVRLQQHFA